MISLRLRGVMGFNLICKYYSPQHLWSFRCHKDGHEKNHPDLSGLLCVFHLPTLPGETGFASLGRRLSVGDPSPLVGSTVPPSSRT